MLKSKPQKEAQFTRSLQIIRFHIDFILDSAKAAAQALRNIPPSPRRPFSHKAKLEMADDPKNGPGRRNEPQRTDSPGKLQ